MTEPLAETILEALGEAVLVVNLEGLIVQLNAAAETLYGVSCPAMTGKPLVELIGEISGEVTASGFEAVMRGEVWRGVVWHQKPNGMRFQAEISVRLMAQHQLLIALVEDVTQREASAVRNVVLSQAAQIIAATDDFEAMKRGVLHCLAAQGRADAALLRGREDDEYRVIGEVGFTTGTPPSGLKLSVLEEHSLLGGEIIRVTAAGRDSRFAALWADGLTELHITGQRVAGRLIGTLELGYRGFQAVDLSPILPALAGAVATQSERSQQWRALSDRNRLLELQNRIDRLSLELVSVQSLLTALREDLLELFGVGRIRIGHVPGTESSLAWLADSDHVGSGTTSEWLGSPLEALDGLVASAVRTHQITPFGHSASMGLCVPISNSEGTLILELSGRAGGFNRHSQHDAFLLATQLALVLSRTQDRENLLRERYRLEVLAGVSAALREVGTQSELHRIAADYALRVTHASTTTLLIANENRDAMEPAAVSGINADQMREARLTRARGLSWRVLDSGKPRIEDIATTLPEAHMVRPLAQGAYIGIPIFEGYGTQRRTIGVLAADTQADGARFTPTDLDCLTAVTEALSSARARLEALDSAERRATAFAQLAQLSADLESLDDDESIAQRGLETLLKLTGLEAAGYFSYIDGVVSTVALIGEVAPEYVTLSQSALKAPTFGVFGRALKLGRTQLFQDYRDHPSAIPGFRNLGFRTVLMAPITLNGQVRAFIGANSFSNPVALPPDILEVIEFLARRLSRAIERADQHSEILSTRASSFRALGLALELRDFETKGHTDRVVKLSLNLGRAVGLSERELQHLEWGALLHDIGKIAVPDNILLKPGPLTEGEWSTIREHPETGYRMLEGLHFLPAETLELVRYHQERSDGSGYPEARRGPEIPFLARLFAVVDVYDALISERPYKRAWSLADAVRELHAQAGVKLEVSLVNALVELLHES